MNSSAIPPTASRRKTRYSPMCMREQHASRSMPRKMCYHVGADMHDDQRTRTADQEQQNPHRELRHALSLVIAHYPNSALVGMQVPLRDGLVVGRDPLDQKSAMAL